MEKSIRYQIIPEWSLVLEYYMGETTLESLIAHKHALVKDTSYDSAFNFISDFRDTVINFSDETVVEYITQAKNIPNLLSPRQIAFLTKTPKQTSSVMLYALHTKNIADIKVFSTLEAAVNWIRYIPSDKWSLMQTIINIERQFKDN